MNRNEKIELIKSIQNGTPLKFAFYSHVTLFNTLDEPDVYYNDNLEIVNKEYYQKQCKKLSFITTVDLSDLKTICLLNKKMRLKNDEFTLDELYEIKRICDKSKELRKSL